MTVPLRTLPPACTGRAVILPAAVDGTSMVAFSVSSVISGVSISTVSPYLDQHLDDRNFVEIAKVRNRYLQLAHSTPSSRVGGSASTLDRYTAKRAPMAPSMTRWS